MNINIICIGKIKESFYRDAVAEYAKRLTRFCKFNILELAESRLEGNDINKVKIVKELQPEIQGYHFVQIKRICHYFRFGRQYAIQP